MEASEMERVMTRMGRAGDTDADRKLIAYAKALGFDVTARALEDWRRAGAMPKRTRIELGRHGTRYEDPPGATDRLVGVCCFLGKQGAFAERPDLPRRRRLADAAPWLWYEDLIPGTEIRDRVIEYWEGLASEIGRAVEHARKQDPTMPEYELPIAAADVIATHLTQHPTAGRPLSVFAKHRDELGENPRVALHAGLSQLFQAMQGVTDFDAAAGYLIEHSFIQSGMEDAPIDDDPARAKVLKGLHPSIVCQAVWRLSEKDWQFVRTFLHTSQGLLISLERHSGDPHLREMGRISSKMNTTGRLLMLAGFIAAIKNDLESGMDRHARDLKPGPGVSRRVATP